MEKSKKKNALKKEVKALEKVCVIMRAELKSVKKKYRKKLNAAIQSVEPIFIEYKELKKKQKKACKNYETAVSKLEKKSQQKKASKAEETIESAPKPAEAKAKKTTKVEVKPISKKIVTKSTPKKTETKPVAKAVNKPVAKKTEMKPVAKAVNKITPKGLDSLRKVEGIGPKIEQLLHNAGILTFQNLADTKVEVLQEILIAAGPRYRMHKPTTWAEQSALAAQGKWEELKNWQDKLKGGVE